MSLTSNERTNLIKLAVGMFNAAPGATYLSELTVLYEANGRSLANVANILANTPAYTTLNPVFQTASEFAAAFLTPLGLQANAVAVDFVVSRFNAGVNKGQIAVAALTALVTTTAPEFATAQALLTNKTSVAEYYSVTKAIAQTNIGSLQQVIATVTADAASVVAADAAIDNGAGSAAGNTFTLTAAIGEQVIGTAGNDTFNAVLGDPAVAGSSTLNIGDVVNGQAGVDTLNLIVSKATALPLGVQVSNVENIVVTNGATSVTAIDASVFAGVQNITLKDNATAVVVSNMNGVTLGVQGVAAASVTGDFGAAATAASLSLKDAAGAVVLTGAAVKTANISGNSQLVAGVAQTVTVTGTAAAGATTVNVDASAALALDVTAAIAATAVNVKGAGAANVGTLAATVKALDASASTGGVKATVSHVDVVVTGGAGKDTVTLANVAALSSQASVKLGAGDDTLLKGAGSAGVGTSAVIDGGDGTDTISAQLLEVGNQANIKNWEILDLAGESRTIDASLFTASTFQSLALSGALGASTVVQNLAGAALNLNIAAASGAFDLTASLKGAATGTSDVANLTYANTLTTDTLVQSFKSAGLDSVNFVSGGKATTTVNTLSLLSDSLNQLKTVTITGANAFTLTNVATNTAETAAAVKTTVSGLTTIDGSAATGNLTITAGASATVGNVTTSYDGLTIKTGSGADNVTSAAKGAVISTGAGDDIITFTGSGVKVDTGAAKVGSATGDVVNVNGFNAAVTVGDGLQTVKIGTGAAVSATLDHFTSVIGSVKGDVVDLSAIVSGATSSVITNVTANVGTAASLTAALVLAANVGGAVTGDLSFFTWVDGNTYLVADNDGTTTAGLTALDGVVQLTGLHTGFSAAAGVVTLTA